MQQQQPQPQPQQQCSVVRLQYGKTNNGYSCRATGRVGVHIVKKMLKLNYQVKTLVRDTKKESPRFGANTPENILL